MLSPSADTGEGGRFTPRTACTAGRTVFGGPASRATVLAAAASACGCGSSI
jgi:hypothetical protein